ncbi:hypothetical protein STEG23_017569 [Scotinomys teguina]
MHLLILRTSVNAPAEECHLTPGPEALGPLDKGRNSKVVSGDNVFVVAGCSPQAFGSQEKSASFLITKTNLPQADDVKEEGLFHLSL